MLSAVFIAVFVENSKDDNFSIYLVSLEEYTLFTKETKYG